MGVTWPVEDRVIKLQGNLTLILANMLFLVAIYTGFKAS